MMFKYNIITIDRLVLCLALRTMEGNEAQVPNQSQLEMGNSVNF